MLTLANLMMNLGKIINLYDSYQNITELRSILAEGHKRQLPENDFSYSAILCYRRHLVKRRL